MPRKISRQTVLILIFLCLVVFFMTTFRMGVVRGESMEPTYADGQVVLVRRRNRFSPPLRRGDVVLVQKDRDVIIKRVFRLPGDEITEEPPNLPRYALFSDTLDYYEQQEEATPTGPRLRLFVPQDYLVVLGDNPKASEDSRYFGPLPLRDVLGTVVRAPGPPASSLAPPSPPVAPMETSQRWQE
jgi:signal peptidase I